ncbi:MAG: ATP-dependent protease [Novosphingobium sp. 12-62-10]|nr:MAG: ATP-dependent protease [Novosphingobium sp. 12-62-10]
MGTATKSTRLSVFPLSGAVLYPGLQLPLHIFEPRYRAMVSDSLARDRRIAMIQPQSGEPGAPLFNIGCVGKIVDVEAMEDGRYNLLLEGKSRFRVIRELEVTTPFRQVEAELLEDDMTEVLSAVERASFERESRKFADAQGYSVDWDSVGRLDDMSLINGVSQIAPFDAGWRRRSR